MFNVTVYKNHEDTRESWRVVASNADGDEVGSVQIRRMTENKAIGFIFGYEVDEYAETDSVLASLISKIIANAPRHNFGALQATAEVGNAGKGRGNVLAELGFAKYATFVNPNTGNTLALYGKTL